MKRVKRPKHLLLNAYVMDEKYHEELFKQIITDIISKIKSKILLIDVIKSEKTMIGFGIFEEGFVSLTLLLEDEKMLLVDLYSSLGFETGKVLDTLIEHIVISKWNWQTFDRKDIIAKLGG